MRRIWIGSALYFILFFILGADRYIAHRSAEDLGIFYQSIASALHGFHNTIEDASHFTVHFSPILYLCAPFVWLAHSALPLVAIQAAVNATVAPALYLIARKRTDERSAQLLALIGFLYPPLCGVTFTDFHENGFVPAVTVWLLYALDAKKYAAAVALTITALCIKEDQAVIIGANAALLFVYFRGQADRLGQRWALAAIALCTITFAAYFFVVRPLAGALGGWHPAVFYTQTQAAANVGAVRAITDRLGYVLLAFAPLAFLPLRSRVLLLSIVPFAEVLLSRAPVTYTMGQHYAAVWIPYVLVAFVCAACDLQSLRAVYAGYALAILTFIVANPLHPKYFLRMPDQRDAQLDAFLATLPADVDLGTQEEAFTHMGFYPQATLGMEEYPRYALFDWNYPDSNWVIRDGPKIRAEVARNRYRVVRARDGIELFERIGPKPPDALRSSPAW